MIHLLVDAVIAFPKFFITNTVALLIAILTDWDTTSLAIVTALLCFVVNPFIAFAGVITFYIFVRLMGDAANASAGRLATQINFLAAVIRDRDGC